MLPKYMGSGGAVFDITPPEPGTQARDRFDQQLAKGQLVPVEPPPPAKPARKGRPVEKEA
jgi:hypothetical protein